MSRQLQSMLCSPLLPYLRPFHPVGHERISSREPGESTSGGCGLFIIQSTTFCTFFHDDINIPYTVLYMVLSFISSMGPQSAHRFLVSITALSHSHTTIVFPLQSASFQHGILRYPRMITRARDRMISLARRIVRSAQINAGQKLFERPMDRPRDWTIHESQQNGVSEVYRVGSRWLKAYCILHERPPF